MSSTRASRQIRRLSPPSYVFSISICSTNLLPKPTRCRSFPVGHLATGQSLNQAITPTYSHFRSHNNRRRVNLPCISIRLAGHGPSNINSPEHVRVKNPYAVWTALVSRNGTVWVWSIEADDCYGRAGFNEREQSRPIRLAVGWGVPAERKTYLSDLPVRPKPLVRPIHEFGQQRQLVAV